MLSGRKANFGAEEGYCLFVLWYRERTFGAHRVFCRT